MKKEYKERWIEALRSGDYKQGISFLTRLDSEGNKTHCCLGVAAELFKDGLDIVEEHYCRVRYYDSASSALPPVLTTKLQLPYSLQSKLGGMNDNGLPFTRIADWIEANVPEDSDSETETVSEATSRD